MRTTPEHTADAAERVTAVELEILDELLEMSPALELGLPLGGSWTRGHTARLRDLRWKLAGGVFPPPEQDPCQDKLFD